MNEQSIRNKLNDVLIEKTSALKKLDDYRVLDEALTFISGDMDLLRRDMLSCSNNVFNGAYVSDEKILENKLEDFQLDINDFHIKYYRCKEEVAEKLSKYEEIVENLERESKILKSTLISFLKEEKNKR